MWEPASRSDPIGLQLSEHASYVLAGCSFKLYALCTLEWPRRGIAMPEVNVINFIEVPQGMESKAEEVREVYVDYFRRQPGFVSSTFYRSLNRGENGCIKYVNIVVWDSQASFERVVNLGFANSDGENADGMRVLGKGFPEPIKVSPGQYVEVAR